MEITKTPINDEFNDILNTEDDQPGPPFFDKTLNFLQTHFNKTNSEIGKLTQKKFKTEDEIELKQDELETTRQLLVEEYRQRRPFNPETGEIVDPPFGNPAGEDDES